IPAFPRASTSSRSTSASPGCPASNLTASVSRRGAWAAADSSGEPAEAALAPSARSMSRITVPSSWRDSPSSEPLAARRWCTRASSSRKLSAVMPPSAEASSPAAESGLRGSGCSGLGTEQILPGVFATEALALFGEFYSLGRERDHVGLAIHIDLALQQLVQLGSHCVLSVTNPRVADVSSQTAAVYSRGRHAVQTRVAYPANPSAFRASRTCGLCPIRST